MKKYLGLIAGLVASVTLTLVANPALARTNTHVDISIGIPGPVYAQPAPVYVQPAPVYVQPRPVYMQPQPVYVQPQPIYMQPQPVYVGRHQRHRHERADHGWRDQDRDGIANRYDRDRDGDGIANRWDRRPQNPYRY